MYEINPGQTCLQKIHLVTRARDPLSLQLRLSSALQAIALHPPGLPEAAVLFVHHLACPPIEVLHLDEMRLLRTWERSLTSSLETIARQAHRPAFGAVPREAPAVLFTNRAELLACLGRDWLDGRLTECWWWRSLLGKLPEAKAVVSVWAEAPEYLPAALELLAQWSAATRFSRAVEPPAARRLLVSMISCFGLRDLQAALAGEGELSIRLQSGVGKPGEREPVGETSNNASASFPPWQAFVQESASPDLHPDQQFLLGIGLSLQRVPQVVRTAKFAAAVRIFHHRLDSTWLAPPVDELASPSDERHPNGASKQPAPARLLEEQPRSTNAPILSLPDSSPRREGRLTGTTRHSLRVSTPGADGTTQPGGVADGFSKDTAHPTSPAEQSRQVTPFDGELIETGLGGLFYLINLALFLGLYADFTAPLRPGLALSIWDFVALVGERLLGDGKRSDPVWDLLARLAGRDAGQAAGQGFEPPSDWRMPPAWLEPFPEQPWEWTIIRARLIVRHPAGFSILNIPFEAGRSDSTDQLEQELLPYRANAPVKVTRLRRRIPAAKALSQLGMAGWLNRFIEYAGARLCRALGLGSPDELPACLCLHAARVRMTSTRLDITFALDEHPLAIRLAGLDRNPGWVPSGGRFVAFHYE